MATAATSAAAHESLRGLLVEDDDESEEGKGTRFVIDLRFDEARPVSV